MTNKPKVGLTSVEAAALYLSEGQTTDPIKASHLAAGNPWDLDALQRSHLTRMMGFSFDLEVNEFEGYIKVWSTEGPEVTCVSKFKGPFDEETIDLLVDTCLEVKMAWDKANNPEDEVVEGEVVEDGDETIS